MIRSLRFLLLALCCCAAISCDKNDNGKDPADALAGTRWQATLIDENPATNPAGEFRYVNEPDYNRKHQYYAWLDCHLDDTFTFKNGRITINDNGSACGNSLDLIFQLASQPYVYDEVAKKLTVGTEAEQVTLNVYEINDNRLKIGITLPTAGGLKYIVFLFKKK